MQNTSLMVWKMPANSELSANPRTDLAPKKHCYSGTRDFGGNGCGLVADGRYLSYDAYNLKEGRRALWILPLFGDRKPFQCAPAVAGNQAAGSVRRSISGPWRKISDFTKWRVASSLGQEGRPLLLNHWQPSDEAELALSTQSLQVKSLRPLFQMNLADTAAPLFDVSADGQRFLAVTPARAESSSISLLLNWPAMLHK